MQPGCQQVPCPKRKERHEGIVAPADTLKLQETRHVSLGSGTMSHGVHRLQFAANEAMAAKKPTCLPVRESGVEPWHFTPDSVFVSPPTGWGCDCSLGGLHRRWDERVVREFKSGRVTARAAPIPTRTAFQYIYAPGSAEVKCVVSRRSEHTTERLPCVYARFG